jgi:hypothetical protein
MMGKKNAYKTLVRKPKGVADTDERVIKMCLEKQVMNV